MLSEEFLYNFSSASIILILFFLILISNEIGYRLGTRATGGANEALKSQTNAIQASVLGLLALLLGFTFTMALQRFDTRSQAVVEESNAIGTAYLRTQLLPEPLHSETEALFRQYVDLRLIASKVDLTREDAWQELQGRIANIQDQLWLNALYAVNKDPSPVRTGLFVQAVNELIDAQGSRNGALKKHVPEVVLYLLFAVFILGGGVLGYACGLGGGRPWLATISLFALIALVVFIIVDLDRPRRGVIQVSQETMVELFESIKRPIER